MCKNSKFKHIHIVLSVLILLNFISSIFNLNFNVSKAANPSYSTNISGIDESKYPGYKSLIESLQKNSKYSNWTFKLYYTGLNWNETIISESQGHYR